MFEIEIDGEGRLIPQVRGVYIALSKKRESMGGCEKKTQEDYSNKI